MQTMKPDIDFHENFFSSEESSKYLKLLAEQIQWEQKSIRLFGKSILEPRLTAWYGDRDAVYTYSGARMTPLKWTPTLFEMKTRVEKACSAAFNSVLLNLYRDQNDSMGFHSDDEKELGPAPVIASVSFGATRKFVLRPRSPNPNPAETYLLTSGSLLIMRGQTQKH